MAKKKNNNTMILILIVLAMFAFSRGGVFSGAVVCVSDEPDITMQSGQNLLNILTTEINNVSASDCDFVPSGIGMVCTVQVITEVTNYQEDICYGEKSTTDPLCHEQYVLGVFEPTNETEIPTLEQLQAGVATGTIFSKSYKGITYYYYPPVFNEINEFEINDYALNSFFYNEKGYGIVGSFFNEVDTIEAYIDTFYTCEEETPPPTTESCEFWEKKKDGECGINTGLIIIGVIGIFVFRMFT